MDREVCELPGCKIIQDKKHFRFGTDAVLLASFCAVKKNSVGADLCSGQGVIALQLCANSPLKHIDTLEIMPELCSMAKESAALNGFEDKMQVFCGDVKCGTEYLKSASYDFIVCNPPYKQSGAGIPAKDEKRLFALHEDGCTLEDVIKLSAKLLKFSGSLYLCQRPSRLADIAVLGRQYKLELKRVRFVHPYKDKAPSLMLCELKRGSAPETVVCSPFILYDDKDVPSAEFAKIYGGDEK